MWMQARTYMKKNTVSARTGGGNFEIQVKGQLDSRWSEWLDGMDFRFVENGEMILSGTIVDQAALMGILSKLYRLNLAILSVNKITD
jgi:hypothetical protein